MDQALKNDIESLLQKVEQVIGNNDWPTTEGHRGYDEDGDRDHRLVETPCPLEQLVTRIREGIGKL